MVILFAFIALFGALSAIFIFGGSPNFKNTVISRVRQGLLTVFSRIYQLFHLNRNSKGFKVAIWLGQWSVPLLYVTVVSYCVVQYFRLTWKELPISIRYSWFHQLIHIVIIPLIYIITLLTIYSDPGTVNSTNVVKAVGHFKPNELIFFPNAVCSTCKLTKPARSKHCGVCNKCFMLFDHHCIWLNNCAGYYNYKYFLGFLGANIALFFYGGYVCILTLRNWKEVNHYSNGWWQLIVATTDTNKLTGILVILCVIFWVITVLFTGLHMRYIYLGVTTNELDKWSNIEYLVELKLLYQVVGKYTSLGNKIYLERATYKGKYVYISLENEDILFHEDEVHPELKLVQSIDDLINIYDKGFINNFHERCIIKYMG